MNEIRNNKSPLFCPDRVLDMKAFIDSSTSTSVIGIPGVGISTFLKHLADQPFGLSLYIDVFGLPNLTSTELFSNLLTQLGGKITSQDPVEVIHACKQALEKLVETNERIIIYFGGFDQLKKSFTQEFFHRLRSLRNVDQKKIVFIFGICRRIDSLVSDTVMDMDLHMLSSLYHLKPYTPNDMQYLLSKYGPNTDLPDEELQKLISLSGGHFQFLQLLLRSERPHDPLNDPFIKLSLRNLYQHLSYQQKKTLQKLAVTGNYTDTDDYLQKVGLIMKKKETYTIFSPLLETYVLSQSSTKLPLKEAKLYSLLKKNLGMIVSKDDIFSTIWKDDIEHATDWALDALIYRLRRHQAFISQGYVIESKKKQGYMLLNNT